MLPWFSYGLRAAALSVLLIHGLASAHSVARVRLRRSIFPLVHGQWGLVSRCLRARLCPARPEAGGLPVEGAVGNEASDFSGALRPEERGGSEKECRLRSCPSVLADLGAAQAGVVIDGGLDVVESDAAPADFY